MKKCYLALGCVLLSLAVPAFSQTAPTTAKKPTETAKPAKQTLDAYVKARIPAILDKAVQGETEFKQSREEATMLLLTVAAHGSERNLDAFRDASYVQRLLEITEKLPAQERAAALKLLRANDAVGRTLAFNMSGRDDIKGVFKVISDLHEKFPNDIEKFAQLTVALALVHDVKFGRQINENRAMSPEPTELFEFYSKNENAMYFGIKPVPAELLIWVVDATGTMDELKWGLKKYAKDEMVGRHFFSIKYDYAHFREGKKKKVTELGFTLPNILQYGGVCADQAYFAMTVGKAIGVPTAYATAQSGEVGHAWVGFLQAQQGRGWWNFDVGRYEEYRGIKGNVEDPQTRQRVPDAFVSLSAEMIGTKAADRQAAVALTDAAILLGTASRAPNFQLPSLPEDVISVRTAPRGLTGDAQLELLDLAMKQNPAYSTAWFVVRDLAQNGKLTLDQKKRASESLLRLCGTKYPDFALAILKPMIESVDDTKEQNKLWNNAFTLFQRRADLAAEIRMEQAELWEKENNVQTAGECYMDVINKFANSGPFVIAALSKAEKLLRDSGKAERIPQLYEQTWLKLVRPRDMAGPFMTQSNWYRVGTLYASKLTEAGDLRKADQVKTQIEAVMGQGK